MTIFIDDAGSGDLLFGVVIGIFRVETKEFRYEIIDVKYFKSNLFFKKEYLKQSTKIVFELLRKMNYNVKEDLYICNGYIFDEVVNDLRNIYDANQIHRVKIVGEPQRLTELAYLDEIRNLGYKPILDREKKRAKSFFDMMHWLKKNPDKIRYAKTGWPRLLRYKLFKNYFKNQKDY